jgi:hypothetical protein
MNHPTHVMSNENKFPLKNLCPAVSRCGASFAPLAATVATRRAACYNCSN